MSDDLSQFYNDLAKVNRRAYKDVKTSFARLTKLTKQLDPIKLLSQLTLTFLIAPEDQFSEESSDTVKWARWIEFLAGYLLANKYPDNPRDNVGGRDIEKIEKLLDEYFKSISIFLTTSKSTDEQDKETEMLVKSARIYSLYVRGESYPHLLREEAQSIYSQHKDWFIKKLGFTINDALLISESIINETNCRINNEKESALNRARQYVEELIKKGEAKNENRREIEASMGCYYYFGNSDKILSFTLDDLISFSGFSKEKCQLYLKRLSQEFGYRNKKFQDVYSDPHAAPWDFNSLYERPIIFHDDKYFVPIPSLFSEVLFHTFYYDLIDDDQYWKNAGEKKYGSWLEQKTASYLKRIFPERGVFLNPNYPDGKELCDVLVLHDRKVFIVQCKTKKLRFESQIGKDFQSIKSDLTKGVKESFDQALRARDFFYKNQSPKIKVSNREIGIDSRQISDIFLVSVTLGNYQNLTTRLANINPTLNLFSDNQYPWAISLFDLGVVTELIEYPSMFIHYARRRLAVERTNFDLLANEIDLLGFYFSQGLFFETEDFKKVDIAALTGFSDKIDRYFFEKYEREGNPQKPRQEMPSNFEEYLHTIENLNSSYKTDCAMRLLEMDYKSRKVFVNAAEKAKEKTKSDSNLHSLSIVMNSGNLGLSFIAMDTNSNLDNLFKQVFSYAVMKKYMTKCSEWVGFGWDKNSKNLIDIVAFLSFEWQEDPEVDKMAKENLKQGEEIPLDRFLLNSSLIE